MDAGSAVAADDTVAVGAGVGLSLLGPVEARALALRGTDHNGEGDALRVNDGDGDSDDALPPAGSAAVAVAEMDDAFAPIDGAAEAVVDALAPARE
jgi:hypothetical protein